MGFINQVLNLGFLDKIFVGKKYSQFFERNFVNISDLFNFIFYLGILKYWASFKHIEPLSIAVNILGFFFIGYIVLFLRNLLENNPSPFPKILENFKSILFLSFFGAIGFVLAYIV